MTEPIEHGGALDRAIARHGGAPEDWLDLSTGINPHAYPVAAVSARAWQRLPTDAGLGRLLAAARAAYRVPDRLDVIAAPGAQALIGLLPRLLAGRTATIVAPAAGTYGEFARCCELAGKTVRRVPNCADVADDEQLAFLVRPNNPDGSVDAPVEVLALCERLSRKGGMLVVDESFCDALPEESLIPRLPGNMVVLRSFGKFFGLAGLRLGFAIGAPDIVRGISRALGPWAASGPAIEIGAAALADASWIARIRDRLRHESAGLAELLGGAGFEIAGTNPLFVLVRHPRAIAVAEALALRHALVRSFSDRPELLRFGLPADEAARKRLQDALAAAQGEVDG
jgi:cobalamin biosynthetic protein CobC